jgi:hypothetical protein
MIVEEGFKKLTWQYFYDNCVEQNDEVLRILKVNKASKRMFSGLYFSIVTVAGWLILNKTDFLPPMLLGNKDGRMENLWKDFPIVADPKYA